MKAKDGYDKLRTARRFFSLIPLVIFLLMLFLLSSTAGGGAALGQVVLRAVLVAAVTGLVCVGAYWFYRYLQERSPGL